MIHKALFTGLHALPKNHLNNLNLQDHMYYSPSYHTPSNQLQDQSNFKLVAMEALAISIVLIKQYKYLKAEIRDFQTGLIFETKKEKKHHQNPRTTSTKKKEQAHQSLFRLQLDDS